MVLSSYGAMIMNDYMFSINHWSSKIGPLMNDAGMAPLPWGDTVWLIVDVIHDFLVTVSSEPLHRKLVIWLL